jgi:hypothetical protein
MKSVVRVTAAVVAHVDDEGVLVAVRKVRSSGTFVLVCQALECR